MPLYIASSPEDQFWLGINDLSNPGQYVYASNGQSVAGEISFIIAKVEMPKDIGLQLWKMFAIWCEKIFLPFGYPPAMFISYLRWKLRDKNCLMKFKRQNLFTLNGKNFSNLQMNIFCPFKFCHNRKNGFRWDVATWATKFWYWTLCLLLWNCHLHP